MIADPPQVALDHLSGLVESLGSSHGIDLSELANARPQWPPWPQPALSALVGPPTQVVERLDLRWLHRFEAAVTLANALSAAVGGPVGGPSGLSLLVERSVILGLQGRGSRSAGGSCRLVAAKDGWLAINLAREADVDLVPAWIESAAQSDAWTQIDSVAPERYVDELVARAVLLGLPVARVPALNESPTVDVPLEVHRAGAWSAADSVPLVVDLSSLWAGPLCGWYLARAGARVIKVESATRADGARFGTPAFYERLNGSKELQQVELARPEGVRELTRLLRDADIVIEASRPRALRSLGIEAGEYVDAGKIWCSITGYGRDGASANRVAFGDDAAAAGGLVTFVRETPWFIGDAAGDPISGLTAALGVLSLWADRRAGMVEISMKHAVSCLTGGTPVSSTFS